MHSIEELIAVLSYMISLTRRVLSIWANGRKVLLKMLDLKTQRTSHLCCLEISWIESQKDKLILSKVYNGARKMEISCIMKHLQRREWVWMMHLLKWLKWHWREKLITKLLCQIQSGELVEQLNYKVIQADVARLMSKRKCVTADSHMCVLI